MPALRHGRPRDVGHRGGDAPRHAAPLRRAGGLRQRASPPARNRNLALLPADPLTLVVDMVWVLVAMPSMLPAGRPAVVVRGNRLFLVGADAVDLAGTARGVAGRHRE